MTSPDKLIQLLQDEVRATAASKYGQSLESADAHVIARARRDYLNTQRGISTRIIESIIQENTMTDQTSNHNADDQEQEQHPTDRDRYAFPDTWPITGPFVNK